MKYTIIGQGFLGTYLHSVFDNSTLVKRSDMSEMLACEHDTIIVVAPTGNRITVNQEPEKDWNDCQNIIETMSRCQYQRLIHISTVDVYNTLTSNNSLPSLQQPQRHYGANRWRLEGAIKELPRSQIVRLPSISDPTIRKNILYDLKNKQWLESINLQSMIQWYVLSDLPHDLLTVINSNSAYTNLVSAPILNQDIVQKFAPTLLDQLGKNQCSKVLYNVHNTEEQYYVQTDKVWQSFEKVFVDNTTK